MLKPWRRALLKEVSSLLFKIHARAVNLCLGWCVSQETALGSRGGRWPESKERFLSDDRTGEKTLSQFPNLLFLCEFKMPINPCVFRNVLGSASCDFTCSCGTFGGLPTTLVDHSRLPPGQAIVPWACLSPIPTGLGSQCSDDPNPS